MAVADRSQFLCEATHGTDPPVFMSGLSQPTNNMEPFVDQSTRPAVVHVVEDDPAFREAERILFGNQGWEVRESFSAEEFLAGPRPTGVACVVVDVTLPGMTGIEMLEELKTTNFTLPAIMLTGRGDAATAIAALRAGAVDYIEKPPDWTLLLASVSQALKNVRDDWARQAHLAGSKARVEGLSPREQEVMELVIDGKPSKLIAYELGINQRTVEVHRANLMRKTGATSLPALVKLVLEANEASLRNQQNTKSPLTP